VIQASGIFPGTVPRRTSVGVFWVISDQGTFGNIAGRRVVFACLPRAERGLSGPMPNEPPEHYLTDVVGSIIRNVGKVACTFSSGGLPGPAVCTPSTERLDFPQQDFTEHA
jgi:hypothetical protein